MSGNADVFSYFGFRQGDPFLAAPLFEWPGLKRAVREMWRVARNRDWGLLHGPPGAGKTEAKNIFRAEYGDKCWIAEVRSMGRRNLRMNNLHMALDIDLDLAALGERPTRDREMRVRQVTRLLAQRVEEKPVILLMDEASSLHQDMLNGIKALRDQRWSGARDKRDRRPYFGLMLFGWNCLAKRIAAVRQNEIRVSPKPMKPMSRAEMGEFLDHVGFTPRKMDEDGRRELHTLAQYPGEVRFELVKAMQHAALNGRRRITADDFLTDVADLARRARNLGIRQTTIAKTAGVSTATVTGVLRGTYTGRQDTRNKVIRTTRRLVDDFAESQESRTPNERRSEDAPPPPRRKTA